MTSIGGSGTGVSSFGSVQLKREVNRSEVQTAVEHIKSNTFTREDFKALAKNVVGGEDALGDLVKQINPSVDVDRLKRSSILTSTPDSQVHAFSDSKEVVKMKTQLSDIIGKMESGGWVQLKNNISPNESAAISKALGNISKGIFTREDFKVLSGNIAGGKDVLVDLIKTIHPKIQETDIAKFDSTSSGRRADNQFNIFGLNGKVSDQNAVKGLVSKFNEKLQPLAEQLKTGGWVELKGTIDSESLLKAMNNVAAGTFTREDFHALRDNIEGGKEVLGNLLKSIDPRITDAHIERFDNNTFTDIKHDNFHIFSSDLTNRTESKVDKTKVEELFNKLQGLSDQIVSRQKDTPLFLKTVSVEDGAHNSTENVMEFKLSAKAEAGFPVSMLVNKLEGELTVSVAGKAEVAADKSVTVTYKVAAQATANIELNKIDVPDLGDLKIMLDILPQLPDLKNLIGSLPNLPNIPELPDLKALLATITDINLPPVPNIKDLIPLLPNIKDLLPTLNLILPKLEIALPKIELALPKIPNLNLPSLPNLPTLPNFPNLPDLSGLKDLVPKLNVKLPDLNVSIPKLGIELPKLNLPDMPLFELPGMGSKTVTEGSKAQKTQVKEVVMKFNSVEDFEAFQKSGGIGFKPVNPTDTKVAPRTYTIEGDKEFRSVDSNINTTTTKLTGKYLEGQTTEASAVGRAIRFLASTSVHKVTLQQDEDVKKDTKTTTATYDTSAEFGPLSKHTTSTQVAIQTNSNGEFKSGLCAIDFNVEKIKDNSSKEAFIQKETNRLMETISKMSTNDNGETDPTSIGNKLDRQALESILRANIDKLLSQIEEASVPSIGGDLAQAKDKLGEQGLNERILKAKGSVVNEIGVSGTYKGIHGEFSAKSIEMVRFFIPLETDKSGQITPKSDTVIQIANTSGASLGVGFQFDIAIAKVNAMAKVAGSHSKSATVDTGSSTGTLNHVYHSEVYQSSKLDKLASQANTITNPIDLLKSAKELFTLTTDMSKTGMELLKIPQDEKGVKGLLKNAFLQNAEQALNILKTLESKTSEMLPPGLKKDYDLLKAQIAPHIDKITENVAKVREIYNQLA